MSKVIDKLIINSPYEEPTKHWAYMREGQEFELRDGRRKSGYWKATSKTLANYDDPGEFVEIELVNKNGRTVFKYNPKKLFTYGLDKDAICCYE